jgi:hypothetical protein
MLWFGKTKLQHLFFYNKSGKYRLPYALLPNLLAVFLVISGWGFLFYWLEDFSDAATNYQNKYGKPDRL